MVCDARAYSFQIFIRILADSYLIRKSSRQMIVFSVSACTFHLPTVCTGTKHLHCHHQICFQNESQENGMQREKKFRHSDTVSCLCHSLPETHIKCFAFSLNINTKLIVEPTKNPEQHIAEKFFAFELVT